MERFSQALVRNLSIENPGGVFRKNLHQNLSIENYRGGLIWEILRRKTHYQQISSVPDRTKAAFAWIENVLFSGFTDEMPITKNFVWMVLQLALVFCALTGWFSFGDTDELNKHADLVRKKQNISWSNRNSSTCFLKIIQTKIPVLMISSVY